MLFKKLAVDSSMNETIDNLNKQVMPPIT